MTKAEMYFPQYVGERHSQLDLFDETQPVEGACLVAFKEAKALSETYMVHGDIAFLKGGNAAAKYKNERTELGYFVGGPGMFLPAANLVAHCMGHQTPVTRDDIETFINDYPERVQELDQLRLLCEFADWNPEEVGRLLEIEKSEV